MTYVSSASLQDHMFADILDAKSSVEKERLAGFLSTWMVMLRFLCDPRPSALRKLWGRQVPSARMAAVGPGGG